MTYYLKYRPQKLNDLDLENVRESLKKIVKSKKIPHAFLFSGPKGSGKTSAARILAKIVNCESKSRSLRGTGLVEPCNKCAQCTSITQGSNIDIIELDAASHRGIDDVRILRDAVKLAPSRAAKKVYIIDEAHMLTTEASNALLKTLEEPPDHVIFILATTNPEKLLETIRSRTTNIKFSKASADEISRSLSRVITGEKIKVEKGVVSAIAKASEGSFRDAVKILEELVTQSKKLKKEGVEEFLFQRKSFDVESFFEFLSKKDAKKAFSEIESAVNKGSSAKAILEAIVRSLRDAYLAKIGLEGKELDYFSKKELTDLIDLFSNSEKEIPNTIIEQLPIEVAIAKWCLDGTSEDFEEVDLEVENEDENDNKVRAASLKPENQEKSVNQQGMKGIRKKNLKSVNDKIWTQILSQVRPLNTSTEALLRAARPVNYDGTILELGVYYKFHKEQLESNQHRKLLEEAVSQILGNSVRIICKLTSPPERKEKDIRKDLTTRKDNKPDGVLSETEDEDIVKVAKDIFGS